MKKLFVWLASVSTCAAQAMSIGPFATEGWVEERLHVLTNDFATVTYVDDLVSDVEDKIPDVSGLATKEYVDAVSNAIPDVSGLATVEQVVAVSNLLPDTALFATREWVGHEITNAVDDLLDGDGYIMTNLVRGSSLADKSITGDKLANNAVNGAIIANLSVSTGKLTNKAVTTSKLADNAVTKDKIDGSVTNWLATTNWVLDIVSSATPGNYSEVSNRAMQAVISESDPTIVLSNRTLFVRNDSIEIPAGGFGTETDPAFTNWLASVYPTNRVEQGSNYKMSIAQNGTVSLTPQWKYVSSSSSSEIDGIAGTVAVVESENDIYSPNPGSVSIKLYKGYGTDSQTLVYHAVGQMSDQPWNVVTNCLDNTPAAHWLPPAGKFEFVVLPDNTAAYLRVRVYHGGVFDEAWSGFPSSRQLKTKILSTTDDGVQYINVGNFVDDSDGQPSYSNLRGEVGIDMVGRSGGTAFISSLPTNKPQIVIGTIEGTNAQYWIEASAGFDGSLPYAEPRLFKQSVTVPGALSAYVNDTGFITTNANGSVNIEAYIAQNPTYTNTVLGNYDVVIGGGTTVFSDRTVKIGEGGVVSNSDNAVVLADSTYIYDSPYAVVAGDAGANINNSSKSFILGGGGGFFVDSPRMVSFVYPGVTVERSPESIIAALGGGAARIYDSRGALVLGDSGGEITNSPNAFVWGNHHNKIKDSMFTIALGANVYSTNSYAFAWNQPAAQTYATHGDGTFNINPVGGIKGFWIGDKNLESYLGSIDNVLYKSTTIEGSESAFQSLKYYDLLDTFVGSRRANRYISLHGALYVGEKADLVSTAFDPNPGGFTLSVGRGDTEAKGRSSVALGNNVTTADDDSFVTGYGGKVTGKIGFASGKNTRAKGNVSTATGEGTTAAGYASNSSGWYTLASAGTSQAHGKYVSAKDTDSWAWSAGLDPTNAPRASLWTAEHADNIQSLTNGFYESHGPGTFNIDPVGGAEGFWIGETNLATYLQNAGGGGITTEADPVWTQFKDESQMHVHTNAAPYITIDVGFAVTDSGAGRAFPSSASFCGADVTGIESFGAGAGAVSNCIGAIGFGQAFNVTNNFAFVWSGRSWDQYIGGDWYGSHGVQTFNVDPVGGLSGFWIGETNLATYLSREHSSILSSDKNTRVSAENGGTAKITTTAFGNAVVSFPAGFSVSSMSETYTAPSGGETLEFFGPITTTAFPSYKFWVPSAYTNLTDFSPADQSIWCLYTPNGDDTPSYLMFGTGPGYSIYPTSWESSAPILHLADGTASGGSPTMSRSPNTYTKTVATTDYVLSTSKLALDAIAPEFLTSKVYTNGDFVIKDTHLYECTNYTGQAGWRANDWQQTTVTGILGNLRRILDAINGEAL